MSRPRESLRLESKAEAIRRAFAHPANAGFVKKWVRIYAIQNWKARYGNLSGRPHPSERMPWAKWKRLTAHRYAKRMARLTGASERR